MHEEKELSAASIKQYLIGIRSFLAYSDIYVIPVQFKRKVKIPKVYREEEQPLDVKDIRQILLNCHNRRAAFQVQLNNSHVTPQSIYLKLANQFGQLLEVAGFNDRKEGMTRRKITLHSLRRFTKTTISDCAGKEYSEWFLGHAKSSYYVNKPEARATTYAEKCMKYLTFLDYSTLEVAEKRVEAQIAQKDKEMEVMRDQLYLLQERHKQRENDYAELKSAVEFLKHKINAAVIADPSSKIINDEKGVPKAIEFTETNSTATAEIAK